jgi:hypothetical protein
VEESGEEVKLELIEIALQIFRVFFFFSDFFLLQAVSVGRRIRQAVRI